MAVAAFVARWMYREGRGIGGTLDSSTGDVLLEIVFYFALVNLLLGLFNLLPIPPLDGSALVERLLPERWLPALVPLPAVRDRSLLFVLVFFTGVIGAIISPFYDRAVRLRRAVTRA